MKKKTKTYTKGDVIVEDIRIGDIHYGYLYNFGVKLQVLTRPFINGDGNWEWKVRRISDGKILTYVVSTRYPHYSANLYTYKAYEVKHYI